MRAQGVKALVSLPKSVRAPWPASPRPEKPRHCLGRAVRRSAERGDEGGCGSPVRLQIRVWPPRGRGMRPPSGGGRIRISSTAEIRSPTVPRDLRPADGQRRSNPRRVGPSRPSGSGRGQTWRAGEGRVVRRVFRVLRYGSGGRGVVSPKTFSTSKRTPWPAGPRPEKPRHCLGRAVRRARSRERVRQSRPAPNPGVAAPRTRMRPPSGGGRIRISSTAEIRSPTVPPDLRPADGQGPFAIRDA